jgi:hypothetical protein
MYIKPIRLVIAFFLLISSFSVAAVANAQTSGGGAAAYVTENGSTRALTSDEVSLAAATQTPAQMEAAAPVGDDIVHPIPQIPIVVDGVRYAPEGISQFNGRVLRYVLDQRTQSEDVIYAFTTLEGLTQYLKDQWGWEPTSTSARSMGTGIVRPMSDSYWTVFYADAYYAGSTILSAPNAAISDLSTVSPGWNDRISSVQVSTGAAWATLYADTSYAGDQLWMQRGTEWSSLAGNGWDNRASSLKVWLN